MIKFVKNKNLDVETILILTVAFLWNEAVYLGARWIAKSWYHYDMTTSMDERIPFLPLTVSIYFGCYLFWVINYCFCAFQDKTARNRFFCADFFAKGICFILFLLIPTTNIRPEITDTSIWGFLMKFLYKIDSADNLFPSIHCLVSWLCWIGVRKNKSIPAIYRYFSLVAALAVCISTLTTRQHVIVDVISGVLLAEGSYFLASYTNISNMYSTVLFKIKSIFQK